MTNETTTGISANAVQNVALGVDVDAVLTSRVSSVTKCLVLRPHVIATNRLAHRAIQRVTMDKSQVSTPSGKSTTSPLDPVATVIERMTKIRDGLDPRDGVACFNRMYLQVTELVGQNLVEGFFEDNAFIERLDVIFAGLYFRNVDAVESGQQADPSWQPLFDARSNRVVWPIQFAFAGMNAHINHDLPLAGRCHL
jgi:hypothetical protein